jgi:CheY-like chemotaxis protein
MEAVMPSRTTAAAQGAPASKRQDQVVPLRASSPTLIDNVGALRPSSDASDDAELHRIRDTLDYAAHAALARVTKVPVVTVIDDDESVRLAIKGLLRSLGYAVYTFASAEGYLRSARVNDTSCLITDVRMPGMKGTELQRHLMGQGRRTPMIFITAFAEETIRTRSLEAGAVGFLSKPFDEQTLINCLDRALKGDDDGIAET